MKVTGEGRMKESITRKRRAPSVANVGSQCDLSLKIPGETPEASCCMDPDRYEFQPAPLSLMLTVIMV